MLELGHPIQTIFACGALRSLEKIVLQYLRHNNISITSKYLLQSLLHNLHYHKWWLIEFKYIFITGKTGDGIMTGVEWLHVNY